MRFMTLYKPGYESDTPPSCEVIANLDAFIEELASSGVLLATDGLQHSRNGARVRYENGQYTLIDGPFAETKELIGGYAILNLDSKEEAVELTKRFLACMGGGESEIRLMHDQPAFEAESAEPTGAAQSR